MNKQIEVLKLAREALETCMYPQQKQLQALLAIDEALAQPPEPRNFCPRCGKRRGGDVNYIHTCTPPRGLEMT